MIALYCLLATWLPQFTRLSPHALRDLFLFAANIFALRNGWAPLGALAPLWSISVEEQFYFAIPFLSRTCSRRALASICCGIVVFSYCTLAWLEHHSVGWLRIWPNSFVQFQFFALGALIALREQRRDQTRRVWIRLLLLAVTIGTWSLADPYHPTLAFLLAAIGSVALFYAVLGWAHVPPVLVYLGKISYGLYLFHQIFLDLFSPIGNAALADLMAFLVAIVAAALSYRFLETPILRLKRRFETVETRPV